MYVAILILVDFPLQYSKTFAEKHELYCRNPYFSGFSLAMIFSLALLFYDIVSQSLF